MNVNLKPSEIYRTTFRCLVLIGWQFSESLCFSVTSRDPRSLTVVPLIPAGWKQPQQLERATEASWRAAPDHAPSVHVHWHGARGARGGAGAPTHGCADRLTASTASMTGHRSAQLFAVCYVHVQRRQSMARAGLGLRRQDFCIARSGAAPRYAAGWTQRTARG